MSGSTSDPVALDYLTQDCATLQLYQFLGPLIDYELTPGPLLEPLQVDPLVIPLDITYNNAEAVNAYMNTLVRPRLGTRHALDFALGLANISPQVDEYWEAVLPLQPYFFNLVFTSIPEGFNLATFLQYVLAIKNERSWLLSIRMPNCVGPLILDGPPNWPADPITATFVGYIVGTTLTVTALASDSPNIKLGQAVYGTNVIPATTITAASPTSPYTGTGGPGTYKVSQSQTVASSGSPETMTSTVVNPAWPTPYFALMDTNYLDNPEGYVDPTTGVIICLENYHTEYVNMGQTYGYSAFFDTPLDQRTDLFSEEPNLYCPRSWDEYEEFNSEITWVTDTGRLPWAPNQFNVMSAHTQS